jgi:hypothetical protein
MVKGRKVDIGTITVTDDGYSVIKTEGGWELVHRLVASEKLGRKLHPSERVYFVDGDRANLDPENIAIAKKGVSDKVRRYQKLRERMDDLIVEMEDLLKDPDVQAAVRA